jgi:allophanate hydrolase
VQQVLAEPVERNTHMGYYTYFANPLRLCAISVPVSDGVDCGERARAMPFILSLAATSFREATLGALARALAVAP